MKTHLLHVPVIFLLLYFAAYAQISNGFSYPLQGSWAVTQDFNVYNNSFPGYHLGEDVLQATEVPVYATATGVVKHVDKHTNYGYVVVIEHRLPDNTSVCSVYGHLRALNIIGSGSSVTKGQVIGYLSSNPDENGGYNFVHLHFGIRSGTYSTALDPDGEWRYRGYGPSSIVPSWYDPSNFIQSNNSSASIVVDVSQYLSVTATRSNPSTIYALPPSSEYGGIEPFESEKNLKVLFKIKNAGTSSVTLNDWGVMFTVGSDSFRLTSGSSLVLGSGQISPLFNKRAYITSDRLIGGGATGISVKVQINQGGVWSTVGGSGSVATTTVYPIPSLTDGKLIKRPRNMNSSDPEHAKIFYYQKNRKWAATGDALNNLFPSWESEYYVYPINTVGSLSYPSTPATNSTIPILTGRNLLYKSTNGNQIYILEPEAGGGSVVSRHFADENAFFTYYPGGSTILLNEPIPMTSNQFMWMQSTYPAGSTIYSNHTITSSSGPGGTIAPLGNTTVTHGGQQTYTITPNSGYAISQVLVDGSSVGAVSTYTFQSVQENHTIQATFSQMSYTIVSSAGSGGTIAPLGNTTVTHGGSQAYTITPNSGYAISQVLVDGSSVGVNNSFEFQNVIENHTIMATFIPSTSIRYDNSILPDATAIYQNYPNPFNPSTTIKFGLHAKSEVVIVMYNSAGEKIKELVSGEYNPGYYMFDVDASAMSSGVYLLLMTSKNLNNAQEYISVKKIILLK